MAEEEYKELVEDTDEFRWRRKEPESHKEIVLRAIENCRKELSKDMREGGTYETETRRGVFPVYFPDQREVIINSVKTLQELMLWCFDEKAEEDIGKIEEKIKGAYDFFLQKYIACEWCKPLRDQAIATRTILVDVANPKDRVRSKVGEMLFQEMHYYLVKLYREMFRELILLFKRKNELSGKKTAGTY